MGRMLHTAYGLGEIVAEDTERGRKTYLVKGAGWQIWVPETDARLAEVNADNSVKLPYDPTPQHPAYPATESTILPGDQNIDPEERLSPADSLTFAHEETSEAGPYPGPASHLFARRTAGDKLLPWGEEDWIVVEQNRLPEDDYVGHPDSWPYPPTEQDYADWEARHPSPPGGDYASYPGGWPGVEEVLAHVRPTGLSDKYADVHGYVDPMSVKAQLENDPIAFIERKAHEWSSRGDLDPRIAELMELESGDSQLRTAAWKDVRKKAMRLRREGNVTVHESNPQAIYASVVGDHGTYETVIVQGKVYDTGGGLGSWICECPWGRWAHKRKVSYVGRFCSHALATYMEMKEGRPKLAPYSRSASLHEAMPYTEDGYVEGDGWIPGEDFDPYDPDEMEIMRAVWAQERADRYRQGAPLSLRPRRLTPDFVVNDTEEEPETVDVESDDRKATGPDQIVHFASSEPDASPIDATAEAAGSLNHLRELSSSGNEEWSHRMDERTDKLRDLVDDLRDQGVDASPLVASMQRRAFNPLDLASMFVDPDTGEVSDPTGISQVATDELGPIFHKIRTDPSETVEGSEGEPFASSDPQSASGIDPELPGVPVVMAFMSEPFNGSGPDQKEWIGSSEDYVREHVGPLVDVTDLGDEPIIKYTEGREASRRTADCVDKFLSWCEDEGVSPSNVALQEYADNEPLLISDLWEIEEHLNGQRQARRLAETGRNDGTGNDPVVLQPGESVNLNTMQVTSPGGATGGGAESMDTQQFSMGSPGSDNANRVPGALPTAPKNSPDTFRSAPDTQQFSMGSPGTDTGGGFMDGVKNFFGDMFGGGSDQSSFSDNDSMIHSGMNNGLRHAAPNTVPTPETTGYLNSFSPLGLGMSRDNDGTSVTTTSPETPGEAPAEKGGGLWDSVKGLGDMALPGFADAAGLAEKEIGNAVDGIKNIIGSNDAEDNSDIVRQFHAKLDEDHWLVAGTGMTRTAGRIFSPSEQDDLIREAHPQGARNLDQLDLEGTHYLAGW